MKSLIMVLLIMATLVGSANAHEGMIALFTDSTLSDNDAELPIGENYNLEIFYIQGDGPELGSACEFRLVLSTPDAIFLPPIWPDMINLTMGDIVSGISISAWYCMGGWYGQHYDIVHLGTVPVRNLADLDTFTVSLVGHPGVNPPAIQITTCDSGFPVHQVQGGIFTFNGVPEIPVPPWLIDAYTDSPLHATVLFSEEVTAQTSEIPTNYFVFETTDTLNSFSVVEAILIQDLRTVMLTLDDFLSGNVDNTVRVCNVEDLDGYQISPGSEMSIRITDVTPPALASISLPSVDVIGLGFSECMDPMTTEDVENYSVVELGNPSNSVVISEARLLSDRKSIQLFLGSPLDPGIHYCVYINNVQDWAGNSITSQITGHVFIPLSIIHTPVACYAIEQVIYVLWEVSDYIYGLESTCLYYRQCGEDDWIELCENNSINPVVMSIPGGDVTDSGLEYYIVATNGIGATAYHGTPDDPHVILPCPPFTCLQPMLSLVGYQSISYVPPLWEVAVEVRNSGPGIARNVNVTMNADIPWLIISDPACSYGDILEGGTGAGISDIYCFDLSSHPGGSFNVWFDVAYEDSCGNEYRLRLDPEFDPESLDDGELSEIRSYNLSQNYPNPFNPYTSINYRIPAAGHVEIMIFEASGKLVRTLLDEYRERGRYTVVWDGRDRKGNVLPSGIYFYRLQSGSFTDTKKMILLR